MPRFFINNTIDRDFFVIEGETARHISKSLRMKPGDEILICDGDGCDYDCTITELSPSSVTVKVNSQHITVSEPNIRVILYQGLPKGSKLDFTIQKSVELGVTEIRPCASRRTVVDYRGKNVASKTDRWNKISLEAAQQSGRGIVPKVFEPCSFNDVVQAVEDSNTMVLYERGGEPVKNVIKEFSGSMNIIIGSEGGFDEQEIEQLRLVGARVATLGKRILRAETAPLAVLAAIMYEKDNMV